MRMIVISISRLQVFAYVNIIYINHVLHIHVTCHFVRKCPFIIFFLLTISSLSRSLATNNFNDDINTQKINVGDIVGLLTQYCNNTESTYLNTSM